MPASHLKAIEKAKSLALVAELNDEFHPTRVSVTRDTLTGALGRSSMVFHSDPLPVHPTSSYGWYESRQDYHEYTFWNFKETVRRA